MNVESGRVQRRTRVASTLLVLGFAFGLGSLYVHWRIADARGGVVEGRVVGHRIDQDGEQHYLRVSFQYQVAGQNFEAAEARPLRQPAGTLEEALRRNPDLAKGKRVQVHYDQSSPGRAGLAPVSDRIVWILAAIGGWWFLLGLSWLRYARVSE